MDAHTLEAIWSASEGEYVFLPELRNGRWHEGDAYTVKAALNSIDYKLPLQSDLYFSPLLFTGPMRRKGMLGKPGVIYADLDGDHLEKPPLEPNIIIATSNGHYHAYWLLDKPADPHEWEKAAKGWSYHIGADPGGWDATQVLRVPGSWNHKTAPPLRVYTQYIQVDRRYDLSEFPVMDVNTGSVAQAEPVPSHDERSYLLKAGIEDDRLPLSARYWLTVTPEQVKALGTIDRSKVMWQVEKALFSAGYTVYEVFHLMHFSGINKFAARPDRLWYEVNRAASP